MKAISSGLFLHVETVREFAVRAEAIAVVKVTTNPFKAVRLESDFILALRVAAAVDCMPATNSAPASVRPCFL